MRERGDGGAYEVIWGEGVEKPIEVEVPPGQVYVLGDNRPQSKDSREFGTVPLADLIGRARQIWLSWSDDDGIRWDSLGKTL